jgi:hypothetical protein
MNHLTRTKVVLYLAVIFIAGSVTGAVLGWNGAQQRRMKPPSPKNFCEHVREKLRNELSLTPPQVQQLDPLLEKQARQMEEIHGRTVQQVNELIRTFNAEITNALNLSPQQCEKLAAMEKQRLEFDRRRGDHSHPPH